MDAPPHHPLLLRLSELDRLSDEEAQAVLGAVARERTIPKGQEFVIQGSRPSESNFIIGGCAGRQRFMEDGQRQFTAIHVAGDFVDLHSFLLTVMDHSVVALSECRIGIVPHSELRTITETHPHLARMLWLTTLIDGAIHREWLVARARRTAEQQLAHLICELYIRSRRVGVAGKDELDFPLTQSETADVLGLSAVHLNRVLQSLRREDILVWRSGRILIGDFDELARRAEFDPTYLNLETKPL